MPDARPELLVYLGDDSVGRLAFVSGTGSVDQMEFAFEADYHALLPRPVLGQQFEDDLTRLHASRLRAPPFFSNLLPEGPLRKLIAERAHVSEDREFFLLDYLGEDLPGAVALRRTSDFPVEPGPAAETSTTEPSPLRFSLAGVQLKFSMVREGRGLTIPASGQGGDWLVKLPDARYSLVPENEYSMMRWAQAAGLDVPPMDLVPAAEIRGLPAEIKLGSANAFAVRRFDRPAPGQRTHIEDFAQVRGLYAADKYERANYETIGNIILRLGGEADFLEYLSRLVFIAAIGNGDAHLKNWSLIYPDRVNARLAPAYDLVSTIQYMSEDKLGLNLAGSKRFEDVSLESFKRFAGRVNVSAELVVRHVRRAAEAIQDAWSRLRPELPIPEEYKARLDAHRRRVPLFNP